MTRKACSLVVGVWLVVMFVLLALDLRQEANQIHELRGRIEAIEAKVEILEAKGRQLDTWLEGEHKFKSDVFDGIVVEFKRLQSEVDRNRASLAAFKNEARGWAR